jgi:hypothetical protein
LFADTGFGPPDFLTTVSPGSGIVSGSWPDFVGRAPAAVVARCTSRARRRALQLQDIAASCQRCLDGSVWIVTPAGRTVCSVPNIAVKELRAGRLSQPDRQVKCPRAK